MSLNLHFQLIWKEFTNPASRADMLFPFDKDNLQGSSKEIYEAFQKYCPGKNSEEGVLVQVHSLTCKYFVIIAMACTFSSSGIIFKIGSCTWMNR